MRENGAQDVRELGILRISVCTGAGAETCGIKQQTWAQTGAAVLTLSPIEASQGCPVILKQFQAVICI